jgi:hypothetical protein
MVSLARNAGTDDVKLAPLCSRSVDRFDVGLQRHCRCQVSARLASGSNWFGAGGWRVAIKKGRLALSAE